MSKVNFQAINDALSPETVLPQWLPGGHKRGNEWVSPNPTRQDNNPGSFTINMVRGVWKDYATGEGGSDLVSLYAYLFHGDDQGEAVKELALNLGMKLGDMPPPTNDNVKKIDDAAPVPVIPVPASATACTSFKHPTHGDPSRIFEYKTAEGQLMLYICRFDPADGSRKQISPRSWCDHPGKASRWTWRGITGAKTKRPMYGLDRLAAMPDADVILVEGEPAADAGQELLGEAAAVVTWMGGTETADRADLKPLAGRRVILFPDFDALTHKETGAVLPKHEQPGMRAMLAHSQALKGIAREVIMVGYEMDPAYHGWDMADAKDAGWTGAKLLAYIAKNSGDAKHKAATPPPAGNSEPNVPLDATVNPFEFPHVSDKGAPMNTVENLEYMLVEYGINVRYNITRKYVEVVVPGRDYGDDLEANCTLAEINSLCARNRMPMAATQEYIKLISSQNRYNPVEDFITSKPWDGVSRFGDLCETLKTPEGYDIGLAAMLLRRWLISAAAAALKPRGFWSKGVLVLQGAQSEGKTSWIKSLLPPELRKLLKVGATIDPANKDSVSGVISHWLVELGELDGTFRKADIARLKGFISQDIDQLRRPYDRLESEYQRRTVFFASVNPKVFLVDETGNTRWWTIPIVAVNADHSIDVQQLWAEAANYYEQGERWWLDREEEARLESTNEDHQEPNTIEELVLTKFNWDAPRTAPMSATELLIAIGYDKPNNKQAKDAGTVMRKLTGGEPKKSNGRLVFMMPPRMRGAADAINDDSRPF